MCTVAPQLYSVIDGAKTAGDEKLWGVVQVLDGYLVLTIRILSNLFSLIFPTLRCDLLQNTIPSPDTRPLLSGGFHEACSVENQGL